MAQADSSQQDTPRCPSFGSLPPELLLMIFRHVWNRDREGQVYLAHCSMVCSKWRPVAQALLFTDVTLLYKDEPYIFLDAIGKNPSLGHATKVLDIRLDPFLPYGRKYDYDQRPRPVNDITAHCPRLYHLILEASPRMDEQLSSLFPSSTLTTLQALSLNVREDALFNGLSFNLPDILHLLHQFTSLAHLRLENMYQLALPLPHPPHPPSPSYELFEFSWINFDTDYEESVPPGDRFNYVSNWLFGKSSKDPLIFEIFEEDYDTNREIIPSFLRRHGVRLISLRIELQAWFIEELGVHLSDLCPNLRELVAPNLALHPSPLRSTLYLPKLEHLACGEIYRDMINQETAEEIIAWILSLPSIRHLTAYLDCIEVDPEYYLVKTWKEKCGETVEVRFLSKDRDIVEEEDMIRPSTFPRRRTMANLSYMTVPS